MRSFSVVLWVIALLAALPAAAQRPAPRLLAFEAALQGTRDAELRWPVAVAAGSAVELAVADAYGARLVIFAAAGVDTPGGGAGGSDAAGSGWTALQVVRLPSPPLAVVHDDRRYVLTLRGHADLATVEPSPSQRAGAEPGRVSLPAGTVPGALAAAPNGGLWLYDGAAARVLALDDEGRPGVETPVAGHLTSLAAAPDGGFFAAFADQARVVRYAPDGRVLGDWPVPGDGPVPAWPDGLAVEPSGGLWLADRHGHRVVALDGAGRLTGVGSGKGWQAGRLLSPAGIARLPDGRLAIADRGNSRVQIFRPTRRPPPETSP